MEARLIGLYYDTGNYQVCNLGKFLRIIETPQHSETHRRPLLMGLSF
jgi:hypothetical protein